MHRAALIARTVHAHETRMDGTTPYITHPEAVATALKADYWPDHVVAAGWLHDVLEAGLPLSALEGKVPDETIEIVAAVTRVPGETYRAYIERVKRFGTGAVAVKVADLTHNLATLPPGHGLRKRYTAALAQLTEGGDA